MRHHALGLFLFLLLTGFASCSRPPTLLVTVSGLPAQAASLSVFVVKQGDDGGLLAPMTDLSPYELPSPAPAQISFVLRLPLATDSQLTVSAAAFSQAGGGGCLLRSGAVVHAFQPSLLDDSATVELAAVPGAAVDTGCQGAARVVVVSPRLLHAKGGDTLQVSGWGFRPGSRIVLDGVPLVTSYRSALLLEATVPPAVRLGAVPLRVEVPAQPAADFVGLRYIADAITFQPLGTGATLTNVRAAHVADLDGDKRPDLAFLPLDYNGTALTLALQKAPLAFTPQSLTVAGKLAGLAAVDVDRDGDIDLVTASAVDSQLKLLRNNGQGVFSLETQALGFAPRDLLCADLGGDGACEVVMIDDTRTRVYTLANDGSGHFGTPKLTTLNKTVSPYQFTSLDFNLDGKIDVVLENTDFANNLYKVTVLLNDGSGLPASDDRATFLPFDDFFDDPFLNRDIDGDGRADLMIPVAIDGFHFFGSLGATPRKDVKIAPSCQASHTGTADLNGDGLGDFMVGCTASLRIEFMLQNTSGVFASSGLAPSVTLPFFPMRYLNDVQAEDLDGDGRPELLASTGYEFYIYRNLSQ